MRRVLRAGEKLRAAFEDFANDVHEAYTFDLNPEYRLKIVKKFDGLSIGARFDFQSGDCRIKAKRAPSATPGGGSRFWRWFKKVEVQPEDGDVDDKPSRHDASMRDVEDVDGGEKKVKEEKVEGADAVKAELGDAADVDDPDAAVKAEKGGEGATDANDGDAANAGGPGIMASDHGDQ